MYGWSSFTPPVFRSRSHGRPSPMWSFSERGLYWVRTTTLSISELTQFDNVKSMMRYLPPKGTAGFARTDDRIERRSPSPPASTTATVRFKRRPPCADVSRPMLAPGLTWSRRRAAICEGRSVRLRQGEARDGPIDHLGRGRECDRRGGCRPQRGARRRATDGVRRRG